jgi:hypothetical protein
MALPHRAGLVVALALVSVLSSAGAGAAQSTTSTGELHGTVTDPSGGVMIAASVTLQSGIGQTWSTTTDRQGQYAFDGMMPGTYVLMVSAQGFVDFKSQVELRARTAMSLDVDLKIALLVSLEVKESPGLSTEARKNLSAFVLTGRDLEALPDDPQVFMLRVLEMAGSTGRPGDVAVYVDGFREYKRLPPKNTIAMVRINSNPFSAEFSQPSVRRIEITTKPGSDSFHGDLRLQARASDLDARSPLADTKPQMQYRNYNGYLQGPLTNTRLGFLLYAGQWKQDDNAIVHATVLDETARVAQPFATTVLTPTTVTSAMVKTDFRLLSQLVNVSYAKTTDRRRNQGLQGGFDLPERAYDRSSNDDIGRLWWTSLGRHVVNDVRVELTRTFTETNAQLAAPAVLVLDAFNAGGNQDAATRTALLSGQVSETVTVQKGAHLVKAGALLETTNQHSTDRSGFGGTFIFGADVERAANGNPMPNAEGLVTSISPIENYRRTIQGVAGYAPSQFSIVTGNPDVEVEQWNLGWFALDDWSISKRVALSFGVRQELQTNIRRRVNLAPRAALSWLLDEKGKNALKLGAGIFYDRVDPEITFYARKLDGVDRQQFVVQRPAFFGAVPASLGSVIPIQSSIYTKSSDLRAPSALITSVGYERELPGHVFAVVQYLDSRGIHQLRLRNVTAPGPGALTAATVAPVLEFESTGRSSQQELMVGLRGNFSARLTLYGNYRFGRRYSDTDTAFTTPADSLDLSTEYGRSADDQPHQFLGGISAQLPAGILVDSSISIASGRPFNITTGRDNNGDTLFADRPSFAQPDDAGAIDTPFGRFNPNPQPGDLRIPRNFGRDPDLMNLSLAVSKTIANRLVITIDSDNLLNTSRLFGSNGVVTSPVFGMPNQALNPRRLEFTIRYSF